MSGLSDFDRIREYVGDHPDSDPQDILKSLDIEPDQAVLAVVEAVKSADGGASGGVSLRPDPQGKADARPSSFPPEPDTRETTDPVAREAALEAFQDAIDYFSAHLDSPLPANVNYETARDYYRECRGWPDETIRSKRLGYAPANATDDLLKHLQDRGHDRDAIRGTGLFTKDLRLLWHGRYVFPYFDTNGRPVYAIARETTPKHSDDFLSGKYAKLAHTKEYVDLEEPIYGIDTLEPGEPVVITEGIPDAIAAHQAGIPCLSPVTTSFKLKHREALAEILESADVPRVYVVNDAEPPSAELVEDSEVEGWDRLHLEQHGEGLLGAVRTACNLADAGIDARVAELPRHGTEKVDLDDYLTRWDGDPRPILAKALPAEKHPAHDAKASANEAVEYDRPNPKSVGGDGERSALFSLDIRDVSGLSWDYRGPNPLGHRGDSENYFVLLEDRGIAYDHKAKVGYNPITYLLVEAGERRVTAPHGSLSDSEVFAAWCHAKTSGYIPEDDPIPRRALYHVARMETDWDGEMVEHATRDGDTFEGLPSDVYDAALEAVASKHGFGPGRSQISDGITDGTWQHETVECEPPTYGADPFDLEKHREHLRGERYDETLAHDGPAIWSDPPGAGKTTNAGLGALEHERDLAVLFDKHRKAREFMTDGTFPDWFDPFHLKGAEQKRDNTCMDADHADEPCPDHGHGSNCPSVCPLYDLNPDDPLRQRYHAIKRAIGDMKAHLVLGDELPGHDEDGGCPWTNQFDEMKSHSNVVGVHEYQTLKTVRDGRDVIVDETPRALEEMSQLDIEALLRLANALEDLPRKLIRTNPAKYSAPEVAAFLRDVVASLTSDNPLTLEAIETPTLTWTAYVTYDPAAGNYVEHEEPSESWHVTEALAQLKVVYTECMIRRIKRDDWNGEPVSLDPVLAALAEAGLPSGPVMKAIAAPPMLDVCPWCRSPVEGQGGARGCSSKFCEWHEVEELLTGGLDIEGRAIAWLEEGALACRSLPPVNDLPDDPIILDATATPLKVAAFYGVDVDDVAVFGDRPLEANMRVTQVLDGQYHASTIRSAMTDEDGRALPPAEWSSPADPMQETIDKAGNLYNRPLFVAKRDLIPLFDFPDHANVIHYGGLRGLNFEECDAVFAIGAPHPNVEDLRRTAEVLASGRDDIRVGGKEHSTRHDAPNPPVYRKLNYVDEAGRGRAVPTKHYTGLVGDLFREARENELEQAIHRARPLLADEPVHVFKLTNVPTDLQIDDVCEFEELTDPLRAILPVADGALDLLEAVDDALAGHIDGVRAEALVRTRSDGTVANKVSGYHRLARLAGINVTERTVRNWIDDLEEVGLLRPEEYEQRAGVSYSIDIPTLKSALLVISGNVGFKVAAVRRFQSIVGAADGTLDWLQRAQEIFDLTGDRCAWGNRGDAPQHDIR